MSRANLHLVHSLFTDFLPSSPSFFVRCRVIIFFVIVISLVVFGFFFFHHVDLEQMHLSEALWVCSGVSSIYREVHRPGHIRYSTMWPHITMLAVCKAATTGAQATDVDVLLQIRRRTTWSVTNAKESQTKL